MKKSKDNKKVFSSNQVMSLLENMNDGIQIISEQHGDIVKRLDKIDGRVDKLDGRVDKLDGRMDKLQSDVTEIKHRLSQKVDLEDFQKLEKRLIKLERIVLSA